MALGKLDHPMQPYPAAVAQIEELEKLAPGWNGHHAPRIPKESRLSAIQLLWRIWKECGRAVPEPTVVAPTPDGGVALEWIVKDGTGERGIEVVCLSAGQYEYSVRNRETGRLEDEQEGIMDPGVITLNAIKPHVAYHFVRAK